MNIRKFLSYVGCGCCGFILPSCTTTPITDRKQLSIIPESKLNAQAARIYEKVKEKEKATVFGYYVEDPNRYGVVEFDKSGEVISLEEKPKNPKSNFAVSGAYLFGMSMTTRVFGMFTFKKKSSQEHGYAHDNNTMPADF